MKIDHVDLNKLIPYARNPRHNEAAVDKVAVNIKEVVIIAGRTCWLAAKKLEMETVPILMADDLTPAQVKAYRLA